MELSLFVFASAVHTLQLLACPAECAFFASGEDVHAHALHACMHARRHACIGFNLPRLPLLLQLIVSLLETADNDLQRAHALVRVVSDTNTGLYNTKTGGPMAKRKRCPDGASVSLSVAACAAATPAAKVASTEAVAQTAARAAAEAVAAANAASRHCMYRQQKLHALALLLGRIGFLLEGLGFLLECLCSSSALPQS